MTTRTHRFDATKFKDFREFFDELILLLRRLPPSEGELGVEISKKFLLEEPNNGTPEELDEVMPLLVNKADAPWGYRGMECVDKETIYRFKFDEAGLTELVPRDMYMRR